MMQPPTATTTAATTTAHEKWQQIQQQILTWHYRPDWTAIKIILAFEAAYQLGKESPLWLHVIGPSSSGKTSLGIAMLDQLFSDHHQLGEITPSTFLSGLTRGKQQGKMNSFLHQIGERGVIFAPDFTNFLSSDELTVSRVAGQLREIYDGKITKRAGSSGQELRWEGKVSVITAFTPSKENAWHRQNREGERFVILRWPGISVANEEDEHALGGLLKRVDIKDRQAELRDLVRELLVGIDGWESREPLPLDVLSYPGVSNIESISYRLARLVGKLRTLPIRSDGKNISHIAGEEGPGRVFKQLIQVAAGWAALMRKPEVEVEDWLLAERLAIDTIPETRRWLLEAFPWDGDRVTRAELLLKMTPFKSIEAVNWHLEELIALDIVGRNGAGELWIKDDFKALARGGCPNWVESLSTEFEVRAVSAEQRIHDEPFAIIR